MNVLEGFSYSDGARKVLAAKETHDSGVTHDGRLQCGCVGTSCSCSPVTRDTHEHVLIDTPTGAITADDHDPVQMIMSAPDSFNARLDVVDSIMAKRGNAVLVPPDPQDLAQRTQNLALIAHEKQIEKIEQLHKDKKQEGAEDTRDQGVSLAMRITSANLLR